MTGEEEEQGKGNEPFLQLACAVFLSARHDVVSETKAEAGFDLRHSRQ